MYILTPPQKYTRNYSFSYLKTGVLPNDFHLLTIPKMIGFSHCSVRRILPHNDLSSPPTSSISLQECLSQTMPLALTSLSSIWSSFQLPAGILHFVPPTPQNHSHTSSFSWHTLNCHSLSEISGKLNTFFWVPVSLYVKQRGFWGALMKQWILNALHKVDNSRP